MKISGNYKEVYFYIRKAIESNAQLLHLSPNGDVWMLYETECYVYMKSHLSITKSMVLTRNVMNNLIRFFRKSHREKKRLQEEGEEFEKNVIEIAPEYIQFDYDTNLRTNIFTGLESGKDVMTITNRLKALSVTSVELDKPNMRITSELLKSYTSKVSRKLTEEKCVGGRKYALDFYADERKNHFKLEGYNLVIKRAPDKEVHHEDYKFDDGYFIPRYFKSMNIHLSDPDIFFLMRLKDILNIEEFYVIPFNSHYIIESHSDGVMTLKAFIPRVNHINLDEVL